MLAVAAEQGGARGAIAFFAQPNFCSNVGNECFSGISFDPPFDSDYMK